MYCKSFDNVKFDVGPLLQGQIGWVNIKVPKSHLLLVLEVSNVQMTFRKPYAANLLVMSNLTLDLSFKVKLGWVNIKVPISHLLLVLVGSNVQSTFRKLCCASFGDVKFDLGPLLQGQTRVGQYKSAHISLIIGSRGLQCTVDL